MPAAATAGVGSLPTAEVSVVAAEAEGASADAGAAGAGGGTTLGGRGRANRNVVVATGTAGPPHALPASDVGGGNEKPLAGNDDGSGGPSWVKARPNKSRKAVSWCWTNLDFRSTARCKILRE